MGPVLALLHHGFGIEDLPVDVAYRFDKSTKQKVGLEEFCVFCVFCIRDISSDIFC